MRDGFLELVGTIEQMARCVESMKKEYNKMTDEERWETDKESRYLAGVIEGVFDEIEWMFGDMEQTGKTFVIGADYTNGDCFITITGASSDGALIGYRLCVDGKWQQGEYYTRVEKDADGNEYIYLLNDSIISATM